MRTPKVTVSVQPIDRIRDKRGARCPGTGGPVSSTRHFSAEDRAQARAERRADMADANRRGELQRYGEAAKPAPDPQWKSPIESFKERAPQRAEMARSVRKGEIHGDGEAEWGDFN